MKGRLPKCMLVRPRGSDVPVEVDRAVERFKLARKRFRWHVASDVEATAAIFKMRSQAASEFMLTGFDCLVMVDDDVEFHWQDVEHLAEQSLTLDDGRGAIVGAVVSKRMHGGGWGVRISDGNTYELHSDQIVELGPHRYIGGALTAYPRSMFLSLIRKKIIPYCPGQGLWPFYIPAMVQNPELGDQWELLCEDWAICHYARQAGHRVFASMKPVTVHYGKYGFTPISALSPETAVK